ncbi:MAG TPA: serine hydrolase [Nitrolancea sp.]|nr:serine hydrolase [Nitrolancea sp.]
MTRRQPSDIPPRRRFDARSRLRHGSALLSSLLVLGTLLSACTSRRLPSPPPGSATSAAGVIQLAPGGVATQAPTPPGAIAPAPAATMAPSSAAGQSPATPSPVPTATADIARTHLAAAELAARVDALVKAAPAHVSVEIGLSDGTTLYQQNAEDLYDAASLYKLGIMVQVYKDRDDGTLTFDDPVTLSPGFFYESDEVYSPDTDVGTAVPVEELLHNMITLSSNVAAEALLNLVGTDEVNQTMADLGLENTKILWSPVAGRSPDGRTTMALVDPSRSTRLVPIIARSIQPLAELKPESSADGAYDLTTAADMASLFKQLLAGTVLSESTSAEMLALLAEQQINDRLPADLPSGTKVAHKTGDLDGLLHDAGVIYAPAGPIVVVVMTDEITDHDAIVDLMRQIAVLAYEYTP